MTGVRPARPHTGLTEDGRRIREVLTYSRRGSRLSDAQAEVWTRRAGEWWVPDEAVDAPDFSWSRWFGREAPLIVEIGSGIGEATVALAAARPDHDVLAFEVWRPGVAETFHALERAGLENVRLISVDAVWSMTHLFAPGSLAELWTFFPDPWPKQRHHRRRLVNAEFAALAASRLRPGSALAAGDRLGRLRRPDGRRARCRAAAGGRSHRPVARPAADALRATRAA